LRLMFLTRRIAVAIDFELIVMNDKTDMRQVKVMIRLEERAQRRTPLAPGGHQPRIQYV